MVILLYLHHIDFFSIFAYQSWANYAEGSKRESMLERVTPCFINSWTSLEECAGFEAHRHPRLQAAHYIIPQSTMMPLSQSLVHSSALARESRESLQRVRFFSAHDILICLSSSNIRSSPSSMLFMLPWLLFRYSPGQRSRAQVIKSAMCLCLKQFTDSSSNGWLSCLLLYDDSLWQLLYFMSSTTLVYNGSNHSPACVHFKDRFYLFTTGWGSSFYIPMSRGQWLCSFPCHPRTVLR